MYAILDRSKTHVLVVRSIEGAQMLAHLQGKYGDRLVKAPAGAKKGDAYKAH